MALHEEGAKPLSKKNVEIFLEMLSAEWQPFIKSSMRVCHLGGSVCHHGRFYCNLECMLMLGTLGINEDK